VRAGAGCIAAVAALGALMGCSLGQGEGSVYSADLIAADCWGGSPVAADNAYDLQPNFFAANPYLTSLQIRVQRGTEQQEVSDGLAVQIDDVVPIREQIAANKAANLPPPSFVVALAPGVVPPCTPITPPNPLLGAPIVHMALYLQYSCHNTNTILYSVGGSIIFSSLFDADPNEANAAEKYTDATFDVQVGDIGDVPVGEPATDVPLSRQTNLVGYFRFYFERGQPAQTFP
jgi:hypothetical protein